ncbi:bifunctional protein-serine/threonine kinase/phosphatase [Marinimicrobium alkaliphilum]|uniref:bifunctional protein-serine/threonine kinase/phosphatase n=1 Tax=Marinimicrobium alkaliphilum TaxID=2202654 RepID=UPI000DB97D5C|nr:bifunctional protein-serine/threonine kinase/phosphatase [Marinimicrobium alkaliphilum]
MQHLQSRLRVRFAQQSDAGRKSENQDTVGARLPDDALLTSKGIAVAVADGVSSSAAAREASQTAITGFLTDYYATPDTWSTRQSAERVIRSLNNSLWGLSQNSVYGEGYLTTFSALILKGSSASIFHIGDTRVYRLRENDLELLTRDHNQRIDRDTVYLSRALGADPALEIDVFTCELQAGDRFVLTSDGIHDTLSASDFLGLVRNLTSPDELVAQAVAEALDAGSEDNLSIQVVDIDALGIPTEHSAMQVLSQLPFPPLLQVGDTLDGLTVQKVLHESNRSQVYQVTDEQGQRLVMKTPSPLYSDDPAYIERFAMEAWIGARIHSPNVVRVIQPPRARACLYYLTDYVPGQTLGEVIKERRQLAIPDAVQLIEQLVRGIRAFHRKETLHQDIKPDNIVLGRQGPVIIDFGSCWVAGVEEIGAPFVRDRILGTLDYSAPEYRYGGKVGPRSDQFSLAVLLYEMLTGKRPYGDAYSKAMDVKAFQRLRYIPASRHNPLIPQWLDKALEKALSIHPGSRYSALSEWLTDIKRPNPHWVSSGAQPLLERNPLRFWQLLAAAGWVVTIVLTVYLLR